MAPRSCITQRSHCINPPANLTREKDELASAQSPVERSDASNNKAFILSKALTPLLVLPPAKNLFTKFIKVFIETTQAQILAEPQKHLQKTKTPKTY